MRDVDEYTGYGLPVYAKGIVQQSVRGRSVCEGYGILVEIGGVRVEPGDLVLADVNGVVALPRARVEEELQIALVIKATEDRLVAEIGGGDHAVAAHRKVSYDDLLKPSPA